MRAIKLALEAYKAELGEEADVKIYLEPPTAADISKGYWDVQDDRIYIPQAEGAIGLITCKALAHRAFIKRHPRIKQPCFLGIAILIGLVLMLLAIPFLLPPPPPSHARLPEVKQKYSHTWSPGELIIGIIMLSTGAIMALWAWLLWREYTGLRTRLWLRWLELYMEVERHG